MGQTSPCVLGLFLLMSLHYSGHAEDVVLTLEPNWSTFFTGESVTFICDVKDGEETDWEYRVAEDNWEGFRYQSNKRFIIQRLDTGYSGKYQCFARCKETYEEKRSNIVSLTVSHIPRATLRPGRTTIPAGDRVTLTCSVDNPAEWTYYWYRRTSGSSEDLTLREGYQSREISVSQGGTYGCRGGRGNPVFYTHGSYEVTIWITSKPKAQLRADVREIPAGGSVTLTCSVGLSAGWIYSWYRGDQYDTSLTTEDAVFLSSGQIRVSQGGLYRCRGERGNPVYYSEYSDSVRINTIAPDRVVVTLEPNWPEIYRGETITVSCEIQGGGDTEWTYEWRTTSSYKPPNQHEYRISAASSSHSGDYRCRGRVKSDGLTTTEWSDSVRLTVYDDKPRPVLTVSPSWLSPGASVTLKCEVGLQSAGWRFFWSKAVPDPSQLSYSSELLPGSSNGTEQDSYMVHGQTHTAGYVCQAGRGDPVVYTGTSEPTFVWSGGVDPSASLTVSPDSAQHFSRDSVSLSCEGNSTEWRVKRSVGSLSHCSYWGKMTGSICNIYNLDWTDVVYWCESGSGEFSNAVNITTRYNGVILVSPVHPVAEGESITLRCKLRSEESASYLFFYKDDRLIQNDTREELTIPAVSKSHEGFYKCAGKGRLRSSQMSPESWLSVKSVSRPENSSFSVPLIVGLVFGLLLIILLLLLFRCTKSKDSCFNRSQSTSQSSATDQTNKQDESQCLYESIKGPEGSGNDESRDDAGSVEFKNVVYENLMYAQLLFHKNGKPPPPAANETVYSEIKVGSDP